MRCCNSAQATELKAITQFYQWTVQTSNTKSETQSKGVITGITTDITDNELLSICKGKGVIEVKRLMRKRNGKLENSLLVCLTFDTPNLPNKIQAGYETFTIKPFIPLSSDALIVSVWATRPTTAVAQHDAYAAGALIHSNSVNKKEM